MRHLAAAGLFAALAIPLTWPLALHLTTHVPGTGPDDNLQFLWNFWWMREALATGLSGYFHTPYLFHPSGVDLVLHTHNAMNAFVGATVLSAASLPTAMNLTILAGCALNGLSAYLLAYRLSSRWLAAVLAGVFFAAHPATFKHLFGQFGLYSEWGLVLFAYALLEALERRGWLWPIVTGVFLAIVVYIDYYYFVYASTFAACVLACRWLGIGLARSPWIAPTRTDHAVAAVALVAAVAAIAIAATGGLVATLGPIRISLRSGANLRALSTAAALVWLWRRWRPTPTARVARGVAGADLRVIGVAGLVCALLIAPVLEAAFAVWRAGQYVSQIYFWRSAPAGMDPGALVLGNPFNAFWGQPIMRLYEALGIFAFDGPAWLGVAPIVLLATRTSWSRLKPSRLWLLVIGVFFVWALGPYLLLFGVNTGLPIPGILLRYIPIVSNARIPGRAVVFVILGIAMLLAMAVSSSPRLRSNWSVAALLALVFVDFWPQPLPLHHLETPPIYEQLARLPAGGLLEIPLGIRDSFGEEGRIDTNVMYFQSVHRKPIVGGYVSRIPPSVRQTFTDSPVLQALLKLSAGEVAAAPGVDGRDVRDFMKRAGVKYVVIDTRIATAQVRDLVLSMPLTLLGSDERRQLYGIE
jgi:hypothetical protein